MANRMDQRLTHPNPLGTYLKDRRAKLDPAALGFAAGRRRTPGLRREEVAQRANISPTWYTWLEQGRGGAPSANVLDRIVQALMLTDVEREHLFLLGLGRPPEVRYRKDEGVTPRLQRVLDALEPSVARLVVGAFRVDAARAGAAAEVEPLVDELCRLSPEFKVMWRDNDVRTHGEGVKHIRHPVLGPIAFEYSAFAVDGRPDLSMVVYNPVTPADAEKIRSLTGSARALERT
jgi:transcriptional regulator with XRE-family HTH domain